MRRVDRSLTALLLAVVAAFGLAIAPVLHAEVHARESARARKRAMADRPPGGASFDDLAWALAHVHDRELAESEEPEHRPLKEGGHSHSRVPRHSHGGDDPRGRGGHGKGSLEHFTLAVRETGAAPPLPAPLLPDTPVLAAPARPPAVLRYLVPAFPQGPPRA